MNEFDLMRIAKMRDIYGLYLWQNYESTVAYRYKVLMKNIISKSGLKAPIYASVDTPSDLLKFQTQVGFP